MLTRRCLPLKVCGVVVVLLNRIGVPTPRSTQMYVGPVGAILRRTEVGFGDGAGLCFFLCFFFVACCAVVAFLPPPPPPLPPVRPSTTRIARIATATTMIAVPGPGGPRDGRGRRRSARRFGRDTIGCSSFSPRGS